MIKYKGLLPFGLLAVLLIGGFLFLQNTQSGNKADTQQEKPLTKLKLAHATNAVGTHLFPLIGAEEGGIFKKYGLEIERIVVQKNADALASGSVDASLTGGFASILTAAVSGHPLVWIASTTSNTPSVIVSKVPKEQITKVGVSSVGGLDYQKVLVGLRLLDIDPANITYVTTPREQEKASALIKGEIDAVHMQKSTWVAFGADEASKNVSVLLDYGTVTEPYFPVSLTTRTDTIENKREALINLIAALLEGGAYAKEHPDQVKKAFVDRYQFSAETVDEEFKTYEESVKTLDVFPNTDVVKKVLELTSADLPKAAEFDPAQFVDSSLVEETVKRIDLTQIKAILSK